MRRSAAARLLRSWIRIPPGAWMFVCCECCVLSGRGLCDELITRPEESYRLWCVVLCDLESSRMRRPWPPLGCSTTRKKNIRLILRSSCLHTKCINVKQNNKTRSNTTRYNSSPLILNMNVSSSWKRRYIYQWTWRRMIVKSSSVLLLVSRISHTLQMHT